MNVCQEIWLSIADSPSYEVSNLGNVRRGLKLKKPITDKQGYLAVTLWINNKPIKRTVARLVATAFIGERQSNQVVRHIDGNKQNNSVINLQYGTAKENEADKKLHGTHLEGERHPQAKLTAAQVVEIRARYIPYCKLNCANALAREYSITASQITRIINRKAWK